MRTLEFAIVGFGLLLGQLQLSPLSEKQAVASAQKTLASELDATLPSQPFADWFRETVGPEAGVNWQLNECNEQPSLAPTEGRDLRACAEVNALLPDGRKAIVMIEVGTFKRGITGKPNFFLAAIEQEGELSPVRQLRDLPEGLRGPGALKEKYAVKLLPRNTELKGTSPIEISGQMARGSAAAEAAPPPPPSSKPAATPTPKPQGPPKVSEGVVRGNALVKVEPLYPANAKRMQAAGTVEVQVTIAEDGRVLKATAMKGHPLLINAAAEAARKWVFKPTMLSGKPVKVESTLTFVFKFTE
jgi:TonB family protein